MAANRLSQLNSHLVSLQLERSSSQPGQKSANDVVIVSCCRTPITRAKKGGLKDACLEDMLSCVFKEVVKRGQIDPRKIQDIAVGNVLTGTSATVGRMASIYAGIPIETSLYSVNRQCSSGLQAVVGIADAIKAGTIDIGIAAGAESMSQHYGPQAQPVQLSEEINSVEACSECLIPMGITSENLVKEYGIKREDQDKLAADSHRKASEAQDKGYFNEEIVPITYINQDGQKVTISKDDGIRKGVTLESLAKLKSVFSETGTTTAGNASQVSDGAAAVLLARRSTAEKMGLPILGKYISNGVTGVPPNLMGIGPAYAIPIALKNAGLSISDLDIIELNEAFASQATYCIQKLKLDYNKVNPKGGAIALGHPLGCTGARQVSTLFSELKRTNKKIGAISMCIGTGMGMCAIFERE